MNHNHSLTILLRVLLVGAVLYLLDGIDLFTFRFAPAHLQFAAIFLALSLVDAAAVALVALRIPWRGWQKFLAIFFLFYAVRYLLIGLEAYYLSDLLPPEVARSLFVNGAWVSAVIAGLATWLVKPGESQQPAAPAPHRWHWTGWLWRPVLCGLAYLVLFIASGILVFRPAALAFAPGDAPAYIAAFDNVENPMGVLLFQLLRGTGWALLAYPALRSMRGSRWVKGLVLGTVFALVMALKNLVPGDLVLGIQAGHTLEVLVENFLFGLVVGGLLGDPS